MLQHSAIQAEIGGVVVPRKPGLRAVQPGETATPRRQRKQTVATAAKTGTPRDLLVAMRDRIAEAVSQPNCMPRDLASLTKRLQDIAHDIDAIDARGEEDPTERLRELELALRELDPEHPLIADVAIDDDKFDASAI